MRLNQHDDVLDEHDSAIEETRELANRTMMIHESIKEDVSEQKKSAEAMSADVRTLLDDRIALKAQLTLIKGLAAIGALPYLVNVIKWAVQLIQHT